MKTKFFTLFFVLFSVVSFSQSQTKQDRTNQKEQVSEITKRIEENPTYQLFPTQNYWTFIKLDTRNGKIWQVHFTIEEDGTSSELILNSIPLVSEQKEVSGRFTLYPTENIYNFLLLDQIDGYVYQVQWSATKENRGVIPIY